MRHCRGTTTKRKVSPAFIRSIRRAYLEDEQTSEALLKALHAVQRGDYKWAMSYARRNGVDLETMYRDYNRLIVGSRLDINELLMGVGRFCKNHKLGIKEA